MTAFMWVSSFTVLQFYSFFKERYRNCVALKKIATQWIKDKNYAQTTLTTQNLLYIPFLIHSLSLSLYIYFKNNYIGI